ncbi:MAG: 10 kDa chaperonin [candidate division TM6 bacterium GW2011_GWE2_41_16]|nr:MAG: 10 kDa chaperonin [candidate division TM6 bacterium GW2011_GWE2_41_16]
MYKKIKPLYDRVVVERVEEVESKTAGGIIIPDAAKEKAQIGKVIAVGNGRILQDGKVAPLQVAVGDTVFFGKYAGTEAGDNKLVLREDEIIGIIL